MKTLIITEKPSVAQQFAKALGVSGKHDGYIENNDYIITWAVGHLVSLSYPEKYDEKYAKWNLADLPFLPEQYKYEVLAPTKKQFDIVKGLLNRNDVGIIANAGDSGREGEYIQRLIFQKAGTNKNAKKIRVWIDSQTEDAIRNGIRDAKDASLYDNLAKAGYLRAIEDYAVGINFTRAFSAKHGASFNNKIKSLSSKKYTPITVGRVMTCVLGMITRREREIRDFKPTDFYGLKADCGFPLYWKAVEGSYFYESPLLYNETGFKDKSSAESVLAGLNRDSRLAIEKADRKTEKKAAPLLYNLAELQNECSKRFKISPDETLKIAQKLYESKLTTYPRTDARVLSSAVCDDILRNLKGLANGSYHANYAADIISNASYEGLKKKHYCDDKKITDHYAIIPTGENNTSGLSELELSVYQIIVDRFLSIFYPSAEYEKIEVTAIHPSKERFFASEKILRVPGYLEIVGYEDNKEEKLVNVQKGQILNAEFSIRESKTQPPKHYTTGSLILAMENAGNLIEDEELRAQIKGCGVGTSATRAETLKKLQNLNYITVNAKTQQVGVHAIGEAVYDIVNKIMPDMLNPEMTAEWEKKLSEVENGALGYKEHFDAINEYVRTGVGKICA